MCRAGVFGAEGVASAAKLAAMTLAALFLAAIILAALLVGLV
jgi:preprotein translocase subunit SecG